MPRFVVLRHDLPPGQPRGVHWDLMLEEEDSGTLRTWSLPEPPAAGTMLIAEALSDHRLDYLDFEGPISQDRGSVTRWDRGTYELLARTSRELVFELCGTRLRGRARLTRQAETDQRWRLLLESSGAMATGLKPGSQTGESAEPPRVVRPAT
ncbi:MAG: DNA polymerase ligase N-terminal domain-containing protein [Pirellulales bacterium]